MALRKYDSPEQAEAVAKEALWLAWVAAGGPQGAGFLQNKPSATKDDVWNNAFNNGDYVGGRQSDGLNVSADYVFGRMLKLSIRRPTATEIDVSENKPRGDYQSWCHVYKTYAALFDAAEHAVMPRSQAA